MSEIPALTADPPAIEVRHLTKFFGRKHREALDRLRAGAGRAELAPLGTAAVIDAEFDVRRDQPDLRRC